MGLKFSEVRPSSSIRKKLSLDDALIMARWKAHDSGKPRFIHYGTGGLVVLDYVTPGTIAQVEPDGTVTVFGSSREVLARLPLSAAANLLAKGTLRKTSHAS